MFGLLLNRHTVALLVKLGHAIPLRVIHPISKHRGFRLLLCRADSLVEHLRKACSVKNIVTEHKADTIVANKLLADDKGLSQTVGRGLLGIGEPYTEVGAIAKQSAKARQISRRGYNEDISDSGQHEYRNRVIYNRLVVDGKQLLAHPFGNGIEPRAGASGQNDSFHIVRSDKIHITLLIGSKFKPQLRESGIDNRCIGKHRVPVAVKHPKSRHSFAANFTILTTYINENRLRKSINLF